SQWAPDREPDRSAADDRSGTGGRHAGALGPTRPRHLHRLPFVLLAPVPHGEHQHAARDERRVRARLWLSRGYPRRGLSSLQRGLPFRQARMRSRREARLHRRSGKSPLCDGNSCPLDPADCEHDRFQSGGLSERHREGDLTFACYTMDHSVTSLLLRSDPLDAVWCESERGLEFVRKARYDEVADVIVSQQRFIATMQGRTATFSTFRDAQFDEAAFEAQLTGKRMPTTVCFYWILK